MQSQPIQNGTEGWLSLRGNGEGGAPNLPRDHESAESVSRYLAWLGSGGQEGSELDAVMRDLRGAQLRDISFRYQFMMSADMRECILDGSDFTKSDLSGSILDGSSFFACDFTKANFFECSARGANFTASKFIGARASKTDFRGANLRKTYLNGAVLHKADLRNSVLEETWFGPEGQGGAARFSETKIFGCQVAGAAGWVSGTADIGSGESPIIISGSDLKLWFFDHGAPEVEVLPE